MFFSYKNITPDVKNSRHLPASMAVAHTFNKYGKVCKTRLQSRLGGRAYFYDVLIDMRQYAR